MTSCYESVRARGVSSYLSYATQKRYVQYFHLAVINCEMQRFEKGSLLIEVVVAEMECISISDGDVVAFELVNILSPHRIVRTSCSDGGVDSIRSEKI